MVTSKAGRAALGGDTRHLRKAKEAHQSGRFALAEELYGGIQTGEIRSFRADYELGERSLDPACGRAE